MNRQPLIDPNNFKILSTKEFKLKDHPANRVFQLINLKLNFGVIPDIIAVSKVRGQNNKFTVQAFVPNKKKKTKAVVPGVIEARPIPKESLAKK